MMLPENPERVLPEIGRDLFDVLVIRTDFSNDEAWNAVVGELHRPWGPGGEFAAAVQLVDAPAWSGATADEVLAAVVDEDLIVVFIADRGTMQSPARALLALSTVWEDVSGLDLVYYQELIESPEPREFRALPAAVHGVQVGLALGNEGFAEFAGAASQSLIRYCGLSDRYGGQPLPLQMRVVRWGMSLSDAQWARIEPLLPDRTPRRGGRWREHRQVIDAIAFKYRTGIP
ncbi:transposase [Streptomyces sp. NBC_00385]|uniref:transposase n=1 Tax=Streptomyces sp. NBC_00385 TaxID=2975733 RepID=UPI003FA3D184